MKRLLIGAVALTIVGTAALAQSSSQTSGTSSQALNAIPPNSNTVTDYYKQGVYDQSNNKIGSVEDVLVDRQGRVTALIIGVGGTVSADKDVAVPFESVRLTNQNNSQRLVMNSTPDDLKKAQGYKYDRSTTTWQPQ